MIDLNLGIELGVRHNMTAFYNFLENYRILKFLFYIINFFEFGCEDVKHKNML